MMTHVLAGLSWAPGFKGLLVVAFAVTVLCGSIFLILATNSGTRLGFLIALTGLFGWLFVMGLVWATYGIGYKGPAPTWKVRDVVSGSPSGSSVETARSLPLPTDLPDPVEWRDANEELLKEFPAEGKDPSLGDLASVDPELLAKINEQTDPWKLLPSSNKYPGEIASTVAESLGPNGQKLFESAADYIVLDTFATGGKDGRQGDSVIDRLGYKVTSAVQFGNDPFLAAVQLQPVIPQETKAGQAPPTPVADPNAPVYTVILERDRGALRLPSTMFTLFCGIVFAILANMLHRRDKLADANRAAVAAAA